MYIDLLRPKPTVCAKKSYLRDRRNTLLHFRWVSSNSPHKGMDTIQLFNYVLLFSSKIMQTFINPHFNDIL